MPYPMLWERMRQRVSDGRFILNNQTGSNYNPDTDPELLAFERDLLKKDFLAKFAIAGLVLAAAAVMFLLVNLGFNALVSIATP